MQETNDQGPAVARALLTAELRSLRDRSGLRQQDIARKLDWDQSKIIRIENGKSAITKTDLAAMLSRYGVEDRERVRELTDLARTAHRKGWWENFADAPVSKEFLSFLGYEHGAPAIRVCDPLQVPGLLQRTFRGHMTAMSLRDHVNL